MTGKENLGLVKILSRIIDNAQEHFRKIAEKKKVVHTRLSTDNHYLHENPESLRELSKRAKEKNKRSYTKKSPLPLF